MNIESIIDINEFGGYQVLIDSIISQMVIGSEGGITYLVTPSTRKAHLINAMPAEAQTFLAAMFLLFCTTITLFYLIARMQAEKISRMRDFMRMMGMNDTPYYLSYFIFHTISSFLLAIVVSIIAKWRMFENVNFVTIFIQIFLMLLSMFFFAVLVKYFSSPP